MVFSVDRVLLISLTVDASELLKLSVLIETSGDILRVEFNSSGPTEVIICRGDTFEMSRNSLFLVERFMISSETSSLSRICFVVMLGTDGLDTDHVVDSICVVEAVETSVVDDDVIKS